MLRVERLQAGFALQVGEITSRLDAGDTHLWVYGPPGSGRRSIHHLLVEQIAGAVAVELPPFDGLDAVAHGMYQAAAVLDTATRIAVLADEPEPVPPRDQTARFGRLKERAQRCAEALADAGRVLILSVPDSWQLDRISSASAHERSLRADAVLRAWLSRSRLPTIVISGARFDLARSEQAAEIALATPAIDATTIDPDGLPEAYAEAAAAVAAELRRTGRTASPIHVRMAVACLALGAARKAVLTSLQQRVALEQLLIERLVRIPDVLGALRRLVCARVDVPRQLALDVAGIDADYAPLVTECIGFGGEQIRINELVRGTLSRAFEKASISSADVGTHRMLADHFRSLDGVGDGTAAAPAHVVPWLEKVHHLAHMGADGAAEWAAQRLTSRELYWDRARALSIEHRDYDGAAAVYRRCIDELGKDSYSLHYLGFNLHLAGKEPTNAESSYREAVRLDPTNPWWNSRVVTFLVDRAQYRAATHEWQDAIERVDRDGQLVCRDPWLARHLHRWVIEAWLTAGRVREARQAFDLIPRSIIDDDSGLQQLEERILDAEETLALGESVYPAQTPPDVRFVSPRVLPDQNSDGALLGPWYPGRVVEASRESVRIVYATPDPEPASRRVLQVEIGADEWKQKARSAPETADGFIEIGEYADGTVRIESANLEPASWADRAAERRATVYLRTWYAA